MPGVLALREAIAAMYLRVRRARYDPETEVTITSGATEAIFCAVAACVHPGDEVIVLEPCYDSYVPAIELNGGDRRSSSRCGSRTTQWTGTPSAVRSRRAPG